MHTPVAPLGAATWEEEPVVDATPASKADRRVVRWPDRPAGLGYGGDYNPEQWPRETRDEDLRLMGRAGVNLVSVGIWSWVRLEPRPGDFRFEELDELLAALHTQGIAVDLATPTAAPPAWLYRAHPEAWVVDAAGVRQGPGSRGMLCPSAPAYRAAVERLVEQLAARYADHPAVALFHVHNEYGAPVSACHCEQSQVAFRAWLLERYGDLDRLNDAWGTAFWGQGYGHIDEVRTPASSATVGNPAQWLDFARFTDHELLSCFRLERDILKAHAPEIPVTTNFMAASCPSVDLWRWAREVDVVANDHYLQADRPDAHVQLALAADLTRSVARGRPWMLMEHSTSAVNWQPRNVAKAPGEMTRNSLSHVARGADAVLFFQWRASRQGAEKFHSAMVPHGGTDTRVFTEVVALGEDLARLAEVRGSTVRAEVALLWDWESQWAQDQEWRPSVDLDHRERTEAFHASLCRAGVVADFVHPEDDLDGYRLVVAPQTYLLSAQAAKNLDDFVRAGGQLVVSYFSGVVDDTDAVHAEGLSGPLGATLGLQVEEFAPLREGETVVVRWSDGRSEATDVWTDRLRLDPTTEVLARYADGPAAGGPAVTRHGCGRGAAWYVGTRLDADGVAHLLGQVVAHAGLRPPEPAADVEVVQRHGSAASFTFLLNHGAQPATVALARPGRELLTDVDADTDLEVPAGAVRVVRTPTAG